MDSKTEKGLPEPLVGQFQNEIDSVASAKTIAHQTNGDVMLDFSTIAEKLNDNNNTGDLGPAVTPITEQTNSIFEISGFDNNFFNSSQNHEPEAPSTSTSATSPKSFATHKEKVCFSKLHYR